MNRSSFLVFGFLAFFALNFLPQLSGRSCLPWRPCLHRQRPHHHPRRLCSRILARILQAAAAQCVTVATAAVAAAYAAVAMMVPAAAMLNLLSLPTLSILLVQLRLVLLPCALEVAGAQATQERGHSAETPSPWNHEPRPPPHLSACLLRTQDSGTAASFCSRAQC